WKLLIPLSLGWLLVLASYDVAGDRGWNRAAAVVVMLAIMAALAGLLALALRAARQRRELEPQGGFA
ncbi:MAG: NADH-quinone oxidoreductase subunit H, partial [bacterium]|nr:NADH-quinone oxidoreductase subunit H [bacterium]